jgi:hypothetical protein
MAKRKQVAAQSTQPEIIEEVAPVESATAKATLEPPRAELPPRPPLADPFPFKTVNAGGSKIHFQHSRQAGEFQIRFGDGGKNEMPSDAVRDFIKSHKIDVVNKAGEPMQVQLFHWNDHDRAWGTRIRIDPAATDEERVNAREAVRQTAKKVFDDVVKLVAEERGNAAAHSR